MDFEPVAFRVFRYSLASVEKAIAAGCVPLFAGLKDLADMAARRGLVCHVGYNSRSAPAVRQARSWTRSLSTAR
ncbi:MAG: hypothetical protein HY321_09690 [Armatimonadetes bacterium]|nr:hypothetical protein [Armatimonadota bacterium]